MSPRRLGAVSLRGRAAAAGAGDAVLPAMARVLLMVARTEVLQMKMDMKLMAGGVGGVLVAAGGIALFVASAMHEPAPTSRAPRQAAEPVEPLAPPRLEPALATTTRASSAAPVEVPDGVEPERYEPELRDGAIRVRRLVVATGVAHREPTGASDVFEVGASPRLYAFVEAVNETGEPVALRVTFEPARGEPTGHVSLEVPASAPRFRTWAYTRHVYTTGRWHVVVRAADGRLVARRPFDVIE